MSMGSCLSLGRIGNERGSLGRWTRGLLLMPSREEDRSRTLPCLPDLLEHIAIITTIFITSMVRRRGKRPVRAGRVCQMDQDMHTVSSLRLAMSDVTAPYPSRTRNLVLGVVPHLRRCKMEDIQGREKVRLLNRIRTSSTTIIHIHIHTPILMDSLNTRLLPHIRWVTPVQCPSLIGGVLPHPRSCTGRISKVPPHLRLRRSCLVYLRYT